jgi:hypothetical protein
MRWKYLTLTAAVLLAAAYQAAHASVIEKPFHHIKILGEIAAPDFDEVKRLVGKTQREAESKNLELRPPFVYLDTPGGSLSEAIAIGRLLRKEQASAQIEWDGICYSACVINYDSTPPSRRLTPPTRSWLGWRVAPVAKYD